MTIPQPQFLEVGDAVSQRRRIAYVAEAGGDDRRPGIFWLSGFLSDMASTKATALAAWAREAGAACTRMDYSGHGASEGRVEDHTIGDWLAEARAVLDAVTTGPQVVVGSSMGGWIALLLARGLAGTGRIARLVLIAPAWDMTERLMWAEMSPEIRATVMEQGVWYRPSEYGGDGYPITRRLIEDGRRHLLAPGPIETGCPVSIIQGMSDPDVPWQGSLELARMLARDDVRLLLIKDGDHRLSREQDLAVLLAEVARR
jgi:pimeloyl-ACP methyl ester carboxylesterase